MSDRDVSTLSIPGKVLAVFMILVAAGAIFYYFAVFTAKAQKTQDNTPAKVIVKTTPVHLGTYPVKIEVMGRVTAALEIALKSRVSGEIIKVSNEFLPGGFVKAREEIVYIDPADYALDIKVKKAAIEQARAVLTLELGQQAIAKDELKIIEQSTGRKLANSDLALRKPQLAQARANLSAARANMELAELNLERTIIKAPFNALIRVRNTNLGDIISQQDTLATLVSTDEFWIDAEIPVHHLRWLQFPKGMKGGSDAVITLDGGRGTRGGKLLKQTGSINPNSHLASVIISVPDPLLLSNVNAKKSPLILGDYVRVTLIGKQLKNAARIAQSNIRDKNTIWLERAGKLLIQPVFIAYEDRQYSYITQGLRYGDKIITSNIITPIHGMDITLYKAPDHNKNGQE
ncbi:MAG: hypothetical protein COA45_07160 [Zetaproteobacteria bacterium]|nr:MAG: hypothetical protein COA45_07160 [Zetaproteobacteria bacterium]